MSATDELRKLLTEHGVDWWTEDDPEEPAYYFVTKWFANGCEQTYEEIPAIRSRSLKAYCVTPEQAIAATLGDNGVARSNNGVTAEQVREAAKSNSRQYESPFDEGVWITKYDWQAIADALNATLGHSLNNPSMSETLSDRGTCRLPETRIDHGSIEYNGTTSWRLCSACGAEVLADPANYCPNCGRKVEG